MTGRFPVTNSILSTEELARRVLPEYGLDHTSQVRLYQTGFNDTYVVSSANGDTHYLRVYRFGWRTREDALCELDALDHLRRKGIPVAYPLRRKNGELLFRADAPEGERSVAVFVEAKGRMLEYDGEAVALSETYGRAVAAMHNALEDFSSPHPRFRLDLAHLIDDPVVRVEPSLAHRRDDLEYVRRFAASVRRRIEGIPDLEQGYCHGDLQGYHAHRGPDGVLTFYDFDCGGFGYLAYDLAVFRWSARFDNQELPRWEAFLRAYRSGRSIDNRDVVAVPLFVCARHLWHMGVHARNAPFWGSGPLGDAYFDRRLEWLKSLASDYGIDI